MKYVSRFVPPALMARSLIAPALTTLFVATAAWGAVGPQVDADDEARPSSSDARAEEARPPVFTRVLTGPKAWIANDLGKKLGTVYEHVVDRRTGRISHVVLETAGREGALHRFAVPYERFSWSPRSRTLVLPLSERQLHELPEFDPSEARLGLVLPVAQPPKGEDRGTPREASAKKDEQVEPRCLLSTRIHAKRVTNSEGAPFGSVSALVLEPLHGDITFVLVQGASRDGNGPTYVVPWRALSADEAGGYSVAKTAAELGESPRVAAHDFSALENRAAVEGVFRFYGVRTPAPSNAKGRKN